MFEELAGRIPGDIDEALYRKYAVAIPIVMQDGSPHILFEVRAGNLRRQPGEICFPGGGRDPGESAEENAVREMAEELQLDPAQIEVLCQMDTFYSMFDNEVAVFLTRIHDYRMTRSPEEVAEVFLVPLRFFLTTEPAAYENHYQAVLGEDFPFERIPGGRNYHWRGARRKVYFYDYGPRMIWGLTAYIMQATVKTLKKELTRETLTALTGSGDIH